jgi:hypothetical protein
VDGARGLSLDELVANSPSTGIAFKPENLVKAVLRSEVKAGRVLERNGRFELRVEGWDAGQLAALRGSTLDLTQP